MTEILCNKDNVVIVIGGSNGIDMANGIVLPDGIKMYEIDTPLPSDMVGEKYCYTPEKGFYINADYKMSVEEQLVDLKVKYDNLIFMLVEGDVL